MTSGSPGIKKENIRKAGYQGTERMDTQYSEEVAEINGFWFSLLDFGGK